MIKTNIYKDFCDHTGLKDSMYETIFNRIEETLQKLNDIKWLYFSYSGREADTSTSINFEKESTIPLFAIELIKKG